MANLFHAFINKNSGYFAVEIDLEDLSTYLDTSDIGLKQAIEASHDQCTAMPIVEFLLKSDEATIEKFIKILRKTKQHEVCEYFYRINFESDTIWQNFTRVVECDEPIPMAAKQHLQQNMQNLIDRMCIFVLVDSLETQQVISKYDNLRIFRYYDKSQRDKSIEYIVNLLINGNNEQYKRFVEIVKLQQPVIREFVCV